MNKLTKIIASTLIAASFAVTFSPSLALAADATPTASPKGILKELFERKGRAAIGSGTLSAKSGTTLTVTKDGKNYTVLTDASTQLRRRFWGKATLPEFQVGDTLNIIGKWTDDAKTTIQARLVRDVSIQKRFGVFFGTVTSVSGSGWVMTTVNRGSQTVTVTSSTKYMSRKEETLQESDVKVGDKVRVRGLWDKTANTITEVTAVKDFK